MTTSTYEPAYNLTRTCGVVDGTTGADQLARPGQRVYVVDVLSQSFQELLNEIRSWRDVQWRGEKLPTLAYRLSGSENAWFIILAFNGLSTPMELRPGMILRVPPREELTRVLSLLNPAKVGSKGLIITI